MRIKQAVQAVRLGQAADPELKEALEVKVVGRWQVGRGQLGETNEPTICRR